MGEEGISEFNDRKHLEGWGDTKSSFSYSNKGIFRHFLRWVSFRTFYQKYVFYRLLSKENLNGKRLLEWGCGKGIWGTILASEFKAKVAGVDVSGVAVKAANDSSNRLGLDAEFFQCDVERLDFPDNTFDYMFSTDVFGHLKNPDKALKELHRVMKPAGRIIMFSETKPDYRDRISLIVYKYHDIDEDNQNFGHINLLTLKEIRKKFENNGFNVIKLFRPTIRSYDSLLLWPTDQYLRIKDAEHMKTSERFVRVILYVFSRLESIRPVKAFFGILHTYLKRAEMCILGNPSSTGSGAYIIAETVKNGGKNNHK